MAGIAGMESGARQSQVSSMLEKISHRGRSGTKLVTCDGATLGAVWPEAQSAPAPPTLIQQAAWDAAYPLLPEPGILKNKWEPFALAAATSDGLFLARDTLGVRPLYYGYTGKQELCFASEVKALVGVAQDIQEFPPGFYFLRPQGFNPLHELEQKTERLPQEAGEIAAALRLRLEMAVARRVDNEVMGCWLSGGLDSSAMAALTRPLVRELHTFASGMPGSEDLDYARQMAGHLGATHHEITVTVEDLLEALPLVIYYLESFDALLVRSTITNYLVARQAAGYVGSVFSGEGGDELFAGYAYLKDIDPLKIPAELVDITLRLHNTALQRVDRSASANGLAVHVPFLDPDVVEFALSIPARYKLYDGDQKIEKWIVRKALEDLLPTQVLWRPKAKFWQGSGVGESLAAYAEESISMTEFQRERRLANGWRLNSKEELMYYRIFRQHFGELVDLSWMGRTKGAPVQ
jgi:asparagine synthase (glutamine-hydrolysing)